MVSCYVAFALISLALVSVSCAPREMLESAEREPSAAAGAAAERRKFVGLKAFKAAPFQAKKSWFASLFSHAADEESPATQELVPLEEVPALTVPKYGKIVFRPVQVLAVPAFASYFSGQRPWNAISTTQDASPSKPSAPDLHVPHAEYGLPYDGSYDHVNSVPAYTATEESNQIGGHGYSHGISQDGLLGPYAGVGVHGYGDHSLWNQGLISDLKKLKFLSNATPALRYFGLIPGGVGWPIFSQLRDVSPLQNFNAHITDLPRVTLPVYGSSVPVLDPYFHRLYAVAPYNVNLPFGQHYQAPNVEQQEQHPAPSADSPPLYDSYGNQLPGDAYASPTSNGVPSFAPPEPDSNQMESLPHLLSDRRQAQDTVRDTDYGVIPEGEQVDDASLNNAAPEEDASKGETRASSDSDTS